MSNYIFTSNTNSVLVDIDGKQAPFGDKELHPYTPETTGDIVFLYDITGILKKMAASDGENLNFSKDRLIIDISSDTINVNGTTSWVDAGALLEALRAVFFLASGGSGTNPLIPEDQRVNTYADLPDPIAGDGQYWIVDQQTGTWILGTRREAGIYKAVAGAWVYRGADVPYYLQDDQFTIKDSSDPTKQLGFEVDQISTGQRRIATWQDKDGTVAYLSDLVVVSSTPPLDLTRRWKNTNDNLIYFYETDSGGLNGAWVSEQLYKLDLNENANTGNGTFLRFGNTGLDQLSAGVPVIDNLRFYYADYTNKNLSLGQFIVYVALPGQVGAAIGSFVTDTVNFINRVQLDIGGTLQEFADLPANRRVSVQWSGAANNDTILIIYYRKRHV